MRSLVAEADREDSTNLVERLSVGFQELLELFKGNMIVVVCIALNIM